MMRPTLTFLALAALAAAPAAAQREQPPAPAPLRPYAVPPVEEFRLPNGIRVAVVRDAKLPIVTGRIIVDAGAQQEPAEKNGLAVLTADLLDAGTGDMTGSQVVEEMERLGAEFVTTASYSQAYAGVTAATSTFPQAFALAARAVLEPAFAETEFQRARAQLVAGHVGLRSSVEGLAYEAFTRAVFEPAAPYSRLPQGTRATLERLTRDDVVQWHRTRYSPANTMVLLVGDVTVAQARELVSRALGGWSAPAVTVPPAQNPARRLSGTRVILLDRPGSVQSGVYVGHASIGFADPAYLPLLGLAHVLGGGFRSRLNMNLREGHGWTYGAGAGLQALRGAGTFSLTSSVRTNATDSAVSEMVREFRRIVAEPVPQQELQAALANLVGAFPSSVQTVQGLAQRMQSVLLYGLPVDYYNTYRERITAVTPEDLRRVAAEKLTPDAVTIVVAGDLAQIEQPLRALNLGPVEVWDPDGNRVR
ncbi:MAG TPA: pitrilysin family protein [Longimicrobium sp.]